MAFGMDWRKALAQTGAKSIENPGEMTAYGSKGTKVRLTPRCCKSLNKEGGHPSSGMGDP
jgi:hypothetical protein